MHFKVTFEGGPSPEGARGEWGTSDLHSDDEVRRIFGGLKFTIKGYFWPRTAWLVFFWVDRYYQGCFFFFF